MAIPESHMDRTFNIGTIIGADPSYLLQTREGNANE